MFPATVAGRRPNTAVRERLFTQHVRTVGVALLLSALAVAGGVAPLSPPSAAAAVHPERSAAAEASGIELVAAPVTPVLDADADTITFTVLLRNTGNTNVPAATVHLALRTEAPIDPDWRDDLADLATEEFSPSLLARVPLPDTPPGEERAVEISVPRAEIPLTAADAGVYLLTAHLRAPAREPLETRRSVTLATSAVPTVWEGSNGSQVAVATVMPILLPHAVRTMPSTAQLADIAPRLSTVLDAAERLRAQLAIDPRLIVAIRRLGDTAPAEARNLLARLEASSLPKFMLQYADADPAAQSALGFDELLEPLGFGYLDDPDDPETPRAPGRAAVDAHIAGAAPGSWPAAGQASPATLELLAQSGLTEIILDRTNVGDVSGPRATINGFDVRVADTALSDGTRTALSAPTRAESLAAQAEIAAGVVLAAQHESPGIVLAVDRGALAGASDPGPILNALADIPGLTPVEASAFAPEPAVLRAGETAEMRRELLRGTTSRSTEIDRLAPLLVRPESLREYQRMRLLEAFAVRHAAPDVDYDLVDDRIRARDEELLRGVEIVSPATTQLVGTSSRVPVTLHNALPFEAQVVLRVSPTSAAVAVPVRTFLDQRVAANGNHVVLVTVNSRVSSGESGLRSEVTDRQNTVTSSDRTLRLVLRSSVESILLISVTALGALLLGVGTWRSLLRRRVSRE